MVFNNEFVEALTVGSLSETDVALALAYYRGGDVDNNDINFGKIVYSAEGPKGAYLVWAERRAQSRLNGAFGWGVCRWRVSRKPMTVYQLGDSAEDAENAAKLVDYLVAKYAGAPIDKPVDIEPVDAGMIADFAAALAKMVYEN